ncbi:MAG: HEPN domain-containing protein [Nitrospinae bacterium]|nr:HEPN domain-containing protein [Nitrospinota bacterium]
MNPPERIPATPEARVLLRVAARDRKTFELLRKLPDAPLASMCFHAQQAVEKWLKATLVSHGVVFRHTHDLEELSHLLTNQGIPLPLPAKEIGKLTPFAVAFRYDDEEVEPLDCEEAARIVETVRCWAENALE